MRAITVGLTLVLVLATARAGEAPVDDVALVLRAYDGLTGAKHVLPTDARLVAEAAVTALSGNPAAAGFGADAAANRPLLERQARALLGRQKQPRAAVWSSIRAMVVAAGDPHTFLFHPTFGPTLETLLVAGKPAAAAGAYFARLSDGRLVVTEVQANGPAAKAGLEPGDVLVKIERHAPTSLSDIFTLYGGTKEPIRLTVQRPGRAKTLELRYRAFEWTPLNVEGRLLPGSVGYLRFRFFDSLAPALIRKQLEELERSGARSLVLDLRGNWGGIPDAIPSVFIGGDPLVVLRDGAGKDEPLPRSGPAWPRPLPMVVLVDGGTYSAAEFMAFMLQDRKVAPIMGTPTGGGLTGVDDLELADGYILHVANTLVVAPVSHTTRPDHRVTPDMPLAERAPDELAKGIDRQLEAATAEAGRRASRRPDQ